MPNTLYLPELREMLAENNAPELQEFCTALHPARTAEFMEGLTAAEAWQVLRHTDPETRGQIFSYFDRAKQVEIIEAVDHAEIARLIANIPSDDRVDILRQVKPEVVEQLMPLVPSEARRDIFRLQAYPESTAGAVMTTQFFRLSETQTVDEALRELRRHGQKSETVYYLYVVDAEDHLRGLVSLRQLVLNDPDTRISDLMERAVVSVSVTDDQEDVAKKLADFDFLAIPVVDREYHLVGIVTYDDVIDVVRQEATEDVHRMGAVAPMAEGYLDTSFVTVWRKRAVWLSLLFVAEQFTFNALHIFEDAMSKIFALAFFVPLCLSTGGNSGSQAATLITRAIALGQVATRDWWRVLRHEMLMGLALGVTLGIIGYFRAALLTPTDILGDQLTPWGLGVIIASSVATICIWGTMVGAMLPVAFLRLGFDPGYASSPFVATFVDVTGIIIYFSIAQLYLM